ncbi:hypothetical protein Pmani_001940 [Petrolisthes manimaculis]|uniref:Uncharacterized protein n=1 Tax=Petrolisthes manimaculis TaxID=1843537 RepID=A0AAE1QLA9_9EUCA|nr:hypothetical protein Pmani_001940 [Petrolisthes manimaculis]
MKGDSGCGRHDENKSEWVGGWVRKYYHYRMSHHDPLTVYLKRPPQPFTPRPPQPLHITTHSTLHTPRPTQPSTHHDPLNPPHHDPLNF